MDIVAYMDHVIIEGQTLRRPSYISRLHWLEVWEGFSYLYGKKNCPMQEPDCALNRMGA